MFKKVILLSLIALAGTSFAADADFRLVNRTGYDINEVYISPTHKNKWGRDRLGSVQLPHGTGRNFTFGDTKNCIQDIKVVFADDGSEVEWEGFNLCELDKITLRYNRKTGDVLADTE